MLIKVKNSHNTLINLMYVSIMSRAAFGVLFA